MFHENFSLVTNATIVLLLFIIKIAVVIVLTTNDNKVINHKTLLPSILVVELRQIIIITALI